MEILDISESTTVIRATRELKNLVFIKRIRLNKTGKWQILK